jgi:hypothetical protein
MQPVEQQNFALPVELQGDRADNQVGTVRHRDIESDDCLLRFPKPNVIAENGTRLGQQKSDIIRLIGIKLVGFYGRQWFEMGNLNCCHRPSPV